MDSQTSVIERVMYQLQGDIEQLGAHGLALWEYMTGASHFGGTPADYVMVMQWCQSADLRNRASILAGNAMNDEDAKAAQTWAIVDGIYADKCLTYAKQLGGSIKDRIKLQKDIADAKSGQASEKKPVGRPRTKLDGVKPADLAKLKSDREMVEEAIAKTPALAVPSE